MLYVSFSLLGRRRFWAFQGVLIVLSTSWAGVRHDSLALEEKGRVVGKGGRTERVRDCCKPCETWNMTVMQGGLWDCNILHLAATQNRLASEGLSVPFTTLHTCPLSPHTHIKDCYQVEVLLRDLHLHCIRHCWTGVGSWAAQAVGSWWGISHFAGVDWETQLSSVWHMEDLPEKEGRAVPVTLIISMLFLAILINDNSGIHRRLYSYKPVIMSTLREVNRIV